MIKNVFYVDYYIKWVNKMYKVHSFIKSLCLVSLIKQTNAKTLMMKNVFYFEYHIMGTEHGYGSLFDYLA